MIISLIEIVYLIVTTLVIGYIFNGIVTISKKNELEFYKRFNWKDFKFACLVAAPGIIFHELGHKFLAMAFGLKAEYSIWPMGLGIGVVLKLLGSGFMLLAPGYVNIFGIGTSFQLSMTALAGPLVNLILFSIGYLLIKYKKNMSRNEALFWAFTKQINLWLFIFNMLPIHPLDGYKVYGRFLF